CAWGEGQRVIPQSDPVLGVLQKMVVQAVIEPVRPIQPSRVELRQSTYALREMPSPSLDSLDGVVFPTVVEAGHPKVRAEFRIFREPPHPVIGKKTSEVVPRRITPGERAAHRPRTPLERGPPKTRI